MYVLENKHIAEVGRINATDKDQRGGVNWKIIYKITSGDPAGHFSVRTDPVTNQGIISVVKVRFLQPLFFYSIIQTALSMTMNPPCCLSAAGFRVSGGASAHCHS